MIVPPNRTSQPLAEPADFEYRARLQRALGSDYELGALLGQGGMGSVYVARDRRLDRDVAVKALRHDVFPSPLVLERFQREAKALAKLRHANILPVYGVGEGDGLAFMITPRIQGTSLRELLDRDGPLPAAEASRIGGEIARALDAAHRLGIIHRDVKPENVLLEGTERHALLADFGIAKSPGEESGLTASGMIIGSPRYMSPEQASGERDIDHRADIYALGAVAYEMLAGRPPFDADNYQRLLVRQLTTEAPSLDSLVPNLPRGLSTAVMRCLAKNPGDRWSSAADVVQAFLDTAGKSAAESATIEGSARSWLERRGAFGLLLNLFIYYVMAIRVMADSTHATNVSLIARPLVPLFGVVMLALVAEMVWTFGAARMRTGAWLPALRAVLGQPRWWQAWYPRMLRHPSNIWDRMPWSIKILRTILFLELAGFPLAIPMIYIVPVVLPIARSLNMPLPLPMFYSIAAARILKTPAELLLALLAGGVLIVAVRSRLSPVTVVRCLLTWRREFWEASGALRLLAPEKRS